MKKGPAGSRTLFVNSFRKIRASLASAESILIALNKAIPVVRAIDITAAEPESVAAIRAPEHVVVVRIEAATHVSVSIAHSLSVSVAVVMGYTGHVIPVISAVSVLISVLAVGYGPCCRASRDAKRDQHPGRQNNTHHPFEKHVSTLLC